MKVAICSTRPKLADKKSNIAKIENYINKVKSDIYVFGEMALTGYGIKDEIRDVAEKKDGPSIEYIKKIAKKKNCYIVFGMPLKDDLIEGLIHNSAIMVHPDGRVDAYNKWFLPTSGPFEEKIFFDEGEDLRVFDTKFGKIGLIICYDLFAPELCKAYSLLGANIIICLSATPSVNRKYFETLIPARALENTVFMVYVNIVGTQENMVFWGGSQIYDPLGNLLIKAPYFKESVKTFEIDTRQIAIARANRPVLRDVRPEVYEDLYEISRHHKLDK